MAIDRRNFLRGTFGGTVLGRLPVERFAQPNGPSPASTWDPGELRHLLPTVSDTALLIKTSFRTPLTAPPTLRVGSERVRGVMNDTTGEFWQFRAEALQPGRRYTLSLTSANGRALCAPWDLSTFPAPDATPTHLRVLFFTCAGGHEALEFLPAATRQRLLRRALSFEPHVAVANGDHVYWDLLTTGATPRQHELAGTFDRASLVFGHTNESVLKRAATPQIVPVYGTEFRSTPVFFLQDDHDHFENDEGTDTMVTFPPSPFMLRLARATQRLYYPQFLGDRFRPAGLPWSSVDERDAGLSESFGTLRYGRLVEVLLYDVRRTLTLAGPTAVFVDVEVERWLRDRSADTRVTHVVHAPSNPFGWSAGKWGEWYPDILGADGRLTVTKTKPYWQTGWLAQHDRLLRAMTAVPSRAPLVVSGDLHAIALGRLQRAGALTLDRAPVTTVLSGPIGTRPGGWPSGRRGIGATVPSHLDLTQDVAPIEQHGFTIADFRPQGIELRFFKWARGVDSDASIDTLQPFHTARVEPPR